MPITTERFDAIVERPPQKGGPRIIWTLEAIAARLGRRVDFVRDTLIPLPGSPVKKMGTWYAVEEDLISFMRNWSGKPTKNPDAPTKDR